MPNEFVAKKGLISNSHVRVTGSVFVLGGILAGTSSYANDALSASYAPPSPSVSASYALSASYAPSSPSENITVSASTANQSYPVLFASSTGSQTVQIEAGASPISINPALGTITNVNLVGTSSWASSSISSSVAFSSSVASLNGAFAYANFSLVGITMTANNLYNCTLTRISLGLYAVIFNRPASNGFYAVSFTGTSASVVLANTPTASVATPFKTTTTNFSMSIANANTAIVRADPISGSIIVFGF